MAVRYVKNFQHPKGFGFTGSAKASAGSKSGDLKLTKSDVQLLNQVAKQIGTTGRMPGVK